LCRKNLRISNFEPDTGSKIGIHFEKILPELLFDEHMVIEQKISGKSARLWQKTNTN
jgi:hypothetical protein